MDSSLSICFDKGSFLLLLNLSLVQVSALRGLTSPLIFVVVKEFRRLVCMSANHFLFKYDALRALFGIRDILEIKPIYGI